MNVSQKGIDLIKAFESCRLDAYPDPGTGNLPITIGWGSTMRKDGSRFKLGDTITEQEAEDLFMWELNNKAVVVNGLLGNVTLTATQFDALVSFAYNLGAGALANSTLLKKVNIDPDDSSIITEFLRWVKAGGRVMKGLVRRREAEAKLYFSEVK